MNNSAYFDKIASQWDNNPTRVNLAKSVVEAINKYIPIKNDMNMIDFGCGSGLVSLQLASQVNTIIAMDTSAGMLAVLKEKLAQTDLSNIQTKIITDEQVQLLPPVDLIVAAMVLHHIPDLNQIMKTIMAGLKPGGWLAIADLEPEDGSFHQAEAGAIHLGIDPGTVQAILEKDGFVIRQLKQVYSIKKEVEQQEKNYPVFLMIAQKS